MPSLEALLSLHLPLRNFLGLLCLGSSFGLLLLLLSRRGFGSCLRFFRGFGSLLLFAAHSVLVALLNLLVNFLLLCLALQIKLCLALLPAALLLLLLHPFAPVTCL